MYHHRTEWKVKISDNMSAADGKYTFVLNIMIIIIIIKLLLLVLLFSFIIIKTHRLYETRAEESRERE